MAQMQALLKIKADVEGEGKVNALGRAIGGLSGTAGRVSSGLKGLAGAAGGLSGALGSLVPLATGAGLAAMAKGAIDAADNMNDLSQKTGVNVESLSKFQQAARDSGSSLEDVGKGLIVLGRNLSMSTGATQRFGESVEEMARKAEQAERDQTDALRNQADSRIALLENETDSRLKELNKRYRKEQRLLDDRYNDQSDREREASDKSLTQQERSLDQYYELRRKSIENDKTLGDTARSTALETLRYQEEDATQALRKRFESERKTRSRQLRDAQQADEDALNNKKTNEEEILKKATNRQTEIIKNGLQSQIDALSAVERGPEAFSKAMQRLGISAVDATGKVRPTGEVMLDIAAALAKLPDGADKAGLAMDLFNRKLGPGLIPFLNNGREGIEAYNATITTGFAQSAAVLNDKLGQMQSRIEGLTTSLTKSGLLPFFDKLLDGMTRFADAFAAMPGPLQAIVGIAGTIAGAFILLVPAISGFITLMGQLGITGAKIGALFKGLGVIWFGLKTAFLIAFQGIWSFLSVTFFPAVLAFFSGPVGWTVLAVAAVVAMAILFRKPLTDFALWLVSWGKPVGQFFKGLWDGMVQTAKTAAAAARSVFVGMAAAIKGVMNGVLRGAFNSVNGAINNINRLINAANAISGKVGGPRFDQLPTLPVPQFAQGAVVDRPTLAVVGEGGEPEYIIPQSKMAAASANYLNGARGGAVIPAFASGGYVGGGNAQINVTTGPVMQQGGQQYVTMADLERAMRKTADGVYSSLRTPAGRYAAGVR